LAHTTLTEPDPVVAARAPAPAPHGALAHAHSIGWHEARELAAELGLRYGRASRRASADGATEEVLLAEAVGRVLAADVCASADLPRFATAAMDGWVLSSCSPGGSIVDGSATAWEVHAGIAAGDLPSATSMALGSARPICTGAPVPPGGAAVLRSELGEISVDRAGRSWLRSTHPVRPAEHIRPAGEEARQGEILLRASASLTPPQIALAAAAGRDTLTVVRRPTVDLLLLGDELARNGHPRGGQVRDALGPAVPAIVAALGLQLSHVRYVPDDPAVTIAALQETTADVVLTTGGSSHGAADHVRGALRVLGARLVFDGVAMRPGHPVILAALPDGRPVLCLPGNPLAALVCLTTLALPLVDAILGRLPRRSALSVAGAVLGNRTHSTRLIACVETVTGLSPVDWQGSGMLRGLAHADMLAVVPPGGVRAGEPVHTVSLLW